MPKFLIDTDSMTISPYEDSEKESSTGERLYNLFSAHNGEKEYEGVIADIQKWYYGRIVKASWCATALSFFANKVGLALHAENVNALRVQCRQLANSGVGIYYDKDNLPDTIQKGDVLFWLWEGLTMTNSSSKHAGVCAATTKKNKGSVLCIGGNQSDKICEKYYDVSQLYAIYRV